MNGTNDFIQIGIDYSDADEDKHCAVLNLYYNDTNHLIYETFDKEQIKALDNVLQNTFEQQRKVMALEIIKEKNVDIVTLKTSNTIEKYNRVVFYMGPYNRFMPHHQELTKEEFNLLKEVLE